MHKFRILIVGCGDVGSTLAHLLSPLHTVYGLRRNTAKLPNNIIAIQADFLQPETLRNLPSVDIVIYCAAPSRNGSDDYQDTYIQGFANVIQALPNVIKHAFFTSSSSVYAQDNHQWVNEQSSISAKNAKTKIMIAAEQQVLNSPFPSTIVRFSGIYGFDRLHLLKRVLAGKVNLNTQQHFTNRIHVEDCAAVLKHLIDKALANAPLEQIYLASDNSPALLSEVEQWLTQQTPSNATSKSNANHTTSIISGKRCDNSLLLKSGYRFIYPNYQAGYKAIIKHLNL